MQGDDPWAFSGGQVVTWKQSSPGYLQEGGGGGENSVGVDRDYLFRP